jgi:hypothetical protein
VAVKLRTSSRRTAELEVALKEHAELEGKLQSETVQLEERLTQATETFREKLHKCGFQSSARSCSMHVTVFRYISDVAELSKAAASAGSSEFEVMSDLRAAVDSMFQQLVATSANHSEPCTRSRRPF